MEYQFKQHVTREDYIAFLMNHIKMNIVKPINVVFFVILLGYLIAAPFITGTGDFTFTYIGFGLVGVMGLTLLIARRNAGKRYDKNAEKFDMSYHVDETAFSYVIGEQKIEKKWIDFYSASEVDDYLYIFVSRDSGTVLVKRDIPDDAIRFIRKQIRAHVAPKRVKIFTDEQTIT